MRISRRLREAVRQRANYACEYCRFPEALSGLRLVVDHVIARQHQGPTALENLALCCQWCNLSKGPNLTGLDPQTGDVFRLFNPRVDKWDEHFHWADGLVVPTTGVARVTVAVLKINHPDRVDVRVGLIREGKLKLD